MTQPWTIGWDEDDTRIRLNFIARAWVAMRSAVRPEGADCAELVWPWPFCYVFFLTPGMAAVMQARRPGAWLQAGGENPTAHLADHFSRTLLDVWNLRGPAVGISIP